ncbi:helix-turn-helix domain-containing protein [Actinocrinis sp.]|uniref:helix-turn-helix transcriptional regulator n=1 Tax=Actinocrinis sp. TaxID=1920516 RepID=UPI0032C22868
MTAAPLWTHTQTAQFLGLPVSTLYQLVSKGIGPRSFRVGRYRRYQESDVRSWLEERASDAPTFGKTTAPRTSAPAVRAVTGPADRKRGRPKAR